MKSALSRAVTVLWIVSALVGCTATKTFRTDHTPRLQQAHGAMRDVLLVGNSVSGTISVILVDGANYERVGDINVIPDKAERLRDIELSLSEGTALPRPRAGTVKDCEATAAGGDASWHRP